MSTVSVFCCLRGCLDGFKFNSAVPHIPRENPIQLDTAFMGKCGDVAPPECISRLQVMKS
jgi:hypothetical protein